MKTSSWVSGSVLKWAAILTMAADHFGASILEVFMLNIWGNSPLGSYFLDDWDSILLLDGPLRLIGRVAFPIFCFLLVQGFCCTRDVKRYALRLGIFALVSELPYDLALHGQPLDLDYQNVFWTLLLGLLTLHAMKRLEAKPWASLAALLLGAVLAEALRTDYGAFGVLLIGVLYLTREKRLRQCLFGALLCAWELTAPLAFALIYFYNGERGRQNRWFFYWFYPAHLLLYYLAGALALPAALGI